MLMKKALLIALALGMVAAWAVPAMAMDLTASGAINIGANFGRNVETYVPGLGTSVFALPPGGNSQYLNHTFDYMDLRAILSFKVAASADLYGVFTFEFSSDRFGETSTNALGLSGMGKWGADQKTIQVKNLYIDFRVPPELPVWMRVGIQTYMIRPTIFLYADAAGATARVKVPTINMDINLMYAKYLDQNDYTAVDNGEFYAIDMSVPIASVKPGAFFAYENIRAGGPNPDDTQLWWLGAYVTGLIPVGNINLQPTLDFIYSGGTIHNDTSADVGYGSFVVRGTLAAVMDKLEIGLGGMYVKGEDADPTSTDSERFQLPRGFSEANYLSGETVIWNGSWGDTLANGLRGPAMSYQYTSILGYWYVRGYAWYAITNWLKVGGQVAFIGDTEKHQDCIDTLSATSTSTNGDADDDHNIGWEFDTGIQLKLYKNLKLNTVFGYLFAQKGLSLGGGVEPQDPWLLRTILIYSF
jgi:hypothetical protein